jgi:very long chain acyl-CoA dehydrogenase
LKELQRAFKNPTAHLSIIFSEAGKRAFRSVGLGSVPSMAENVHPNLASSAMLVAKVNYFYLLISSFDFFKRIY